MFAVGCLFYFQYSKQIRLKKEENEQKDKPVEVDLKDEKKEQRKAILKGKTK